MAAHRIGILEGGLGASAKDIHRLSTLHSTGAESRYACAIKMSLLVKCGGNAK